MPSFFDFVEDVIIMEFLLIFKYAFLKASIKLYDISEHTVSNKDFQKMRKVFSDIFHISTLKMLLCLILITWKLINAYIRNSMIFSIVKLTRKNF